MLVSDDTQWGRTADIVIVGFGAAGAVAAITTCERGARVLILEKQSGHNHISTSSMSYGAFICPTNVPQAFEYMEHLSRVTPELYWTDKEVLQVWAEYATQNKAWLEGLGAKVKLFVRHGEHKLPGVESIEVYYFPGLGRGLMDFLKHQVEVRDIQVMYDTPADKLLTNTSGEVVGVRALSQGQEIYVKALKAVIMAPGGFEFNERMKLNYLRVYPTYFAGSPANTGDGVSMVQEIGASLWHMNCCSSSWVLKFPEFPIGLGPNFGGSKGFTRLLRDAVTGPPCGFIIVDKYGRRFTSEKFKRHVVYYDLALYDSQNLEYPRVPSYWIFDQKRIKAGPLPLMFYGPMLHRLYQWSNDNSQELARGWIIQGESIEELADKLLMEPAVLKETVQDFNTYCERKEDPEFHRPPEHLVSLSTAPFYATKIWPGSANTQGGARRNHRAQILNADGEPIPRLYAAGEFGSVYGMLYPSGGGNIAECIAFGRVAAENAVNEPAIG